MSNRSDSGVCDEPHDEYSEQIAPVPAKRSQILDMGLVDAALPLLANAENDPQPQRYWV